MGREGGNWVKVESGGGTCKGEEGVERDGGPQRGVYGDRQRPKLSHASFVADK